MRAQPRGRAPPPSQMLHSSAAARENLPETPALASGQEGQAQHLLMWRSYSTVYSQAFPVNNPLEDLLASKGRPYL